MSAIMVWLHSIVTDKIMAGEGCDVAVKGLNPLALDHQITAELGNRVCQRRIERWGINLRDERLVRSIGVAALQWRMCISAMRAAPHGTQPVRPLHHATQAHQQQRRWLASRTPHTQSSIDPC